MCQLDKEETNLVNARMQTCWKRRLEQFGQAFLQKMGDSGHACDLAYHDKAFLQKCKLGASHMRRMEEELIS